MKCPPPIPLLCGFTIPRQTIPAIAASTAFPPLIRMSLNSFSFSSLIRRKWGEKEGISVVAFQSPSTTRDLQPLKQRNTCREDHPGEEASAGATKQSRNFY